MVALHTIHLPGGPSFFSRKGLCYLLLALLINIVLLFSINIQAEAIPAKELPSLKVNLMSIAAPTPHVHPAHTKPQPKPVMQKAPEVVQKHVPKAKPIAQKKPTPKPKPVIKAAPLVKPTPPVQVPAPIVTAAKAPMPYIPASNDRGTEASTVIAPARYRKQVPPVYPRRAMELGQQGMVMLHAQITPNGQAEKLKIADSSGHRLLDMAALSAVKKWEFEPPTYQNRHTTGWVSVPVHFVLR